MDFGEMVVGRQDNSDTAGRGQEFGVGSRRVREVGLSKEGWELRDSPVGRNSRKDKGQAILDGRVDRDSQGEQQGRTGC